MTAETFLLWLLANPKATDAELADKRASLPNHEADRLRSAMERAKR